MISAAYITHNEAKYIARSINSIKELAGEIIVVDHHSDDDTALICNGLGAIVIPFEWKHDFSRSRNFAKTKCSGDWLICLDADEHFEGENMELVRRAVECSESQGIVAWSFIRKNHYPIHDSDSPFFGPPFYPDFQVRLFRNLENIFYSGAVHEGVSQSITEGNVGIIGRLSVCIHHHMFRGDKEAFEDQKGRYYKMISEGHFLSSDDGGCGKHSKGERL